MNLVKLHALPTVFCILYLETGDDKKVQEKRKIIRDYGRNYAEQDFQAKRKEITR